ncbi:TetR/AcrR family transcriptional regulator [Actinoplanes sp. NBC_00393]|uniref:TetR/AcrR family transcriptional regulator n=1 Tax=Actinoplanes sp. NBC_00393 TaxID=2975953 RepID=UPI002E24A51E
MPRVSSEHRANRRAEILAAATACFAKEGFHATSMADIIRTSGMSAGAVYSYFRSKEEIIGSVAETVIGTADEVFVRLLADNATPSPAEAVTNMVNGVVGRAMNDPVTGQDLTRIALQVWAEALRNPELRERVGGAFHRLRGHCAEVARRWQAAGNLPPDAVPEDVGAAMLSLVQGFILQHQILGTATTPADYAAGATMLLSSGAPDRT